MIYKNNRSLRTLIWHSLSVNNAYMIDYMITPTAQHYDGIYYVYTDYTTTSQ